MDFAFAEEQQAVSDVVEAVLADREFVGVVPEIGYDEAAWRALAANGVLSLALPERLGGDGLGLAEVSVALRVLGKHGALTPALATLGFGVVPLVELASGEQQDRYLAGVGDGAILTAALDEPGRAVPSAPAVSRCGRVLAGVERTQDWRSSCRRGTLDTCHHRQWRRCGGTQHPGRDDHSDTDGKQGRRVRGDLL